MHLPDSQLFKWFIALVAIFATLPLQRATAQDNPNQVVLEDERVIALFDEAVLLTGGLFTYDDETRFIDEDGNEMTPTQFTPRTPVRAVVDYFDFTTESAKTSQLPSSLAGELVELQRIGDPEPLVLAGRISEIDDDEEMFLLNGVEVYTDENTEIRTESDEPLEFGDLAVDDLVEVRGWERTLPLLTDHNNRLPIDIIATEVVRRNQPQDPVLVEGEIQALNPGGDSTPRSLTVDNQEIEVTSDTEIVDQDNEEIGFGDLAVGDRVRVFALSETSSGAAQLVAFRIKLLDNDDVLMFEFIGPITEMDTAEECFVMEDERSVAPVPMPLRICTNSETIITNEDGDELGFGDLQEDDYVKALVYAPITLSLEEASFLAKEVIVREDDSSEPIVVEGEIDEIGPSIARYNGWIRVADLEFLISPTAEILDEDGNEISSSDLNIGDFVRVHGREILPAVEEDDDDIPLVAFKIEVLEDAPPLTELRGDVIAIDDNARCFDLSVAVANAERLHEVCTDNRTFIRKASGEPLDFEDLEAGDEVLVRGEASDTANSRLLAVEIVVFGSDSQLVTIQGAIQAIEQAPVAFADAFGVIILREKAFMVTPDTELIDPNGEPLEFEELEVGDLVRATGRRLDSTRALLAVRVKLLRNLPPPVPVEFRGIIESIHPERSQLVVRGILVKVTDDTDIRDTNGEDLGFGDLEVGNRVKVSGVRSPERPGVLAREILLLEEPGGQVEFTGPITEIPSNDPPTLLVAGRVVFATSGTVILDLDNRLIRFEDLSIGQIVEVEGTRANRPAPEDTDRIPAVDASKIEVESLGSIRFHVSGILGEMDGDIWSVGERRFRVTDDTDFALVSGEPLEAEDFQSGDYVDVHGEARPGALPVAHEVILHPNLDTPVCRPNMAFDGPIEEVDTTAQVLVIGDKVVRVEDFTQIIREGDGPIGLEDLSVGEMARVRAEGDATTDAEVVACTIHVRSSVEPPPSHDHRIVGVIDEIDANERMVYVRDRGILVTDETRIVARRDGELGFEDLEAGQLIDARGRLDAGDVLVAALIRVQEENHHPRPPRRLVGRVQSLDLPTSMTVRGKAIGLRDETEFRGFNNTPLDPEDLTVGDLVVVWPDHGADVPAVFPEVIPAKRVRLRAAILEDIDTASQILTVAGGPVQVTSGTVIRELPGERIDFSDLAVGDLLGIRLSPLAIFPPQATHVFRVERPSFSGEINGMERIEAEWHEGRPGMRSRVSGNTLGFVSLPSEMAVAEPNTIYDVRMRVSTDVADPARVPTSRLRANMANYEKGATLVMNPVASMAHVPTPQGQEYSLLFVPPAELTVAEEGDAEFFASLDMLNFSEAFADDALLSIESLDVVQIADWAVDVLETLSHDEFVGGTEGWVFGSAPDAFTEAKFGSESGALRLGAEDYNSFGFWTKDTRVIAEPGKVYRARFLVSTNTDDPSKVPTFRLRLNSSSFELGTTVNVDAVGTVSETLRPEARIYDVYLRVPENASGEDTLLASIDLLGFTEGRDLDTVITLEEFFLEEITLNQ